MEIWEELGLFAGQTTFVVIGIVLILLVLASLASRTKSTEIFKIESLNRKFRRMSKLLREQTLPKKELKRWVKAQKLLQKQNQNRPRAYVLEFEGDVRASQVEGLRKEVSMILTTAQ